MKQHLLQLLQKLFDNKLSSQLNGLLDAKETHTQSAISYLLPTLLGKLAQKANQTSDLGALALSFNKFDTSLLQQTSTLFSGKEVPETHAKAGQKIVKNIFGDQAEDVIETIAAESGLKAKDTKQLLQMISPLAMGTIAKEHQNNKWNNQELAKQLLSQKEGILKETPKKMAELLGFSNIPDLDVWQNMQRIGNNKTTSSTASQQAVQSSSTTKAKTWSDESVKSKGTSTTSTNTKAPAPAKKSNKWLPILGLCLLALVAFLIFNQVYNKSNTQTATNTNNNQVTTKTTSTSHNGVVQKTALKEQQQVQATPVNNSQVQTQATATPSKNAANNNANATKSVANDKNKGQANAKKTNKKEENDPGDGKVENKRYKKSEIPVGSVIIDPTAPKDPSLNNLPGATGNTPPKKSPLNKTKDARGNTVITDEEGRIQNTMPSNLSEDDITNLSQNADGAYIALEMTKGKDASSLGISNGIISKLANDLSKADKGVVKNEYLIDQFNGANGATLNSETKKQLDEVAKVLKAYPEVGITFMGHANASGDRRTDHKTSGTYAYACQKYLMDNGIDREQVRHERLGSTYAKDNSDNNRVVLKVTRRK